MKNYNDKLLISARKLWKTLIHNKSFIGGELLAERIEQYKKMLNIFQVGEYYYMLFDLVYGEVASVSNEVTNVLGYEPEVLSSQILLDSIHPNEKDFFLNIEEKITSFLNSIPVEDYQYYKFQYDVRLKTKSGQYKRILVQYLMADYDDHNIYHSFHIHTDISHIKPEGASCFSIIGIEDRPSYYNIQNLNLQKSFDLFTKREREILKEIIEGKTTLQIAKKLFISHYTVNAHRRNIMEKAEVNTPLELVSKSIKEGWI
ncbi:DNA-binding CsgD family transcriptional regulator [Chryseobacterium defluvii]|uniref:DNA-binding CsgD family transcriptional regulator n=1 Tax=Chryseobacterium defluvii TaxID=160396 RepID=A0A840KE34_9FLAO|nr:helix-turn-helix transcriptional regulator [Chryseobacterium defluvii]MBB4805800.1 DNA-binding CsgD family transcriptional regulator [Chryseobacterium defluvii]